MLAIINLLDGRHMKVLKSFQRNKSFLAIKFGAATIQLNDPCMLLIARYASFLNPEDSNIPVELKVSTAS
jgi:hypothetical protein